MIYSFHPEIVGEISLQYNKSHWRCSAFLVKPTGCSRDCRQRKAHICVPLRRICTPRWHKDLLWSAGMPSQIYAVMITGWFNVCRERVEKGVSCVLKQVEFVFCTPRWYLDLPWSAVLVCIYAITQYLGCSVAFSSSQVTFSCVSQSGGLGGPTSNGNCFNFSIFSVANSPPYTKCSYAQTLLLGPVTSRATSDIKPTLSEVVYWR